MPLPLFLSHNPLLKLCETPHSHPHSHPHTHPLTHPSHTPLLPPYLPDTTHHTPHHTHTTPLTTPLTTHQNTKIRKYENTKNTQTPKTHKIEHANTFHTIIFRNVMETSPTKHHLQPCGDVCATSSRVPFHRCSEDETIRQTLTMFLQPHQPPFLSQHHQPPFPSQDQSDQTQS